MRRPFRSIDNAFSSAPSTSTRARHASTPRWASSSTAPCSPHACRTRSTGSRPKLAYIVRLSPQGAVEWVDGDGTVYTSEPNTGLMRRAMVEVMSWLPIDWML